MAFDDPYSMEPDYSEASLAAGRGCTVLLVLLILLLLMTCCLMIGAIGVYYASPQVQELVADFASNIMEQIMMP